MLAADRTRAELVDALRRNGRIRSPAVEEAFRAVPRHLFLPGRPILEAYADDAVTVQYVDGVPTSSASQPSMMAIMLEQLALRPGHRVLEIGAGTGYNAALIARIVGPAGSVTSVDIDEELVGLAAGHLASAGVREVDLVVADGALGHPPGAPYDRIVLTVGAADIRPEWVSQLAPGGRLLLPLAVRGSQLSVAFDLGADGVLRSDSLRSCGFIRMRGVGSGSDPTTRLRPGLLLQAPGDGSGVDPADVGAVLADPGKLVAVPVSLGPDDVRDGFGLWLAITEPGACRLVAESPDVGLPDALPVFGTATATIALAGDDGLAAVVLRSDRSDPGRPGPVAVRAFGPAGGAQAVRLLGALEEWLAMGRPEASDWRIAAVPGSAPGPPAVAVIAKEHCRLFLDVPRNAIGGA